MKQLTPKILVVDDDPRLRELLVRYLTEQGFQVQALPDARELDKKLQRDPPHLLVLDLMLPGEDGLAVCRRLRGSGETVPIIMLTAKGEDIDRIVGLEMGADDYLPKPFNPRELVARIHAVLRRQIERLAPGAPVGEGRIDATVAQSIGHAPGPVLVHAQNVARSAVCGVHAAAAAQRKSRPAQSARPASGWSSMISVSMSLARTSGSALTTPSTASLPASKIRTAPGPPGEYASVSVPSAFSCLSAAISPARCPAISVTVTPVRGLQMTSVFMPVKLPRAAVAATGGK
jgi:DNA-binding response OmpR family regulator